MKVLLINGSPHEKGCTYTALCEAEEVFLKNGIEAEILYLGKEPVAGCIACGACRNTGRCFVCDKVNEIIERLDQIDGIIVGSPVYYAGISGQITSFLNRLFYAAGGKMAGKPAAAVVSCRRGGASAAFEILNKYKFVFQKRYGQNFLIDEHVLGKIIRSAGITEEDFVVEIGPGIGTLTQYLAASARQVAAIEIDDALIPILEDTLSGYDNVMVIHDDVLKVDLAKLAEEENGGKPVKIVANLPYYITTPIIMGLFENHVPVESITVMVQKEVADRMKTGPGSKDYGALSLAVQYYARPELVANVPPNCFMPRPRVGSAVIRLQRHENPPVEVQDEKLMFQIIRASFNQRRKTLVNGLGNAPELRIPKEQTTAVLEEMGLNPGVRGEALDLQQFAELSNRLKKILE